MKPSHGGRGKVLQFYAADTLARLAALDRLEQLLAEAEELYAVIEEALVAERQQVSSSGVKLPHRAVPAVMPGVTLVHRPKTSAVRRAD